MAKSATFISAKVKFFIFISILFSQVALSQVKADLLIPTALIGSDNFVIVNPLGTNVQPQYRQLLNAIGNISMGCTGTHLGKNVVITAGHCFDATERYTEARACSGVQVAWGNRGNQPGFLISNCTRILGMQTKNGLDYALFLVDKAPPAAVAIDQNSNLFIGKRITIFSHPRTLPLRWSKNCALMKPQIPTFSPFHLFHTCDTEGGSSGAALIDAQTLKIIGIHNGHTLNGITPRYYNYGTDLRLVPIQQILIRNRVSILPPTPPFDPSPTFPSPLPPQP